MKGRNFRFYKRVVVLAKAARRNGWIWWMEEFRDGSYFAWARDRNHGTLASPLRFALRDMRETAWRLSEECD